MTLESPAQDIERRRPVWDAMQMLYMDTSLSHELSGIVEVCAASPYTEDQLREILLREVFPACRFNGLSWPAPEWSGFDLDWLTNRVLETHRHGRRIPLFGRL